MRVFSEREVIVAAARKAGVPSLKAVKLLREYRRLVAQELRARHDVQMTGLGVFHVVDRRAGFGGHRVKFQPSIAIRKALQPRQVTEAAAALRARFVAGRNGGAVEGGTGAGGRKAAKSA